MEHLRLREELAENAVIEASIDGPTIIAVCRSLSEPCADRHLSDGCSWCSFIRVEPDSSITRLNPPAMC